MRARTLSTLSARGLSAACTATGAGSPAGMPSPSPRVGEGCSAGPAATAACQFIATLQTEGRGGLFNQEFIAAQNEQPLPDTSWRVEACAAADAALVTCQVSFEGSPRAVTFHLVATNAEDADGRLVVLSDQAPIYDVQSYESS